MAIAEATRDEWIKAPKNPKSGFLRPGSIRIYGSKEGYGTPPGIEDYPFQQLDIEVAAYDYRWLRWARTCAENAKRDGTTVINGARCGDFKHPGFTPLGTSVATLLREGHDMLAADCGYCSSNLATCKCNKGSDSE